MASPITGPYPLLLASKSEARARMLADLNFDFQTYDPAIDEAEVKRGLVAEGATGAMIAETLAELKGRKASLLHPGHLVIAGDQVLDCNGRLFDKPENMEQAFAHLMALAGKTHRLETSVCLVLDGQRLWHHNEHASIEIRDLTEFQIAEYLKIIKENALYSVGCYRIEIEGALIISTILGNPYTIQGMPTIPLARQLEFLGFLPIG